MDGGGSRSKLGSFLLGGLLGGLAGLAASRLRLPGGGSPRRPQPGLGAFEGAPCYQELLDQERAVSAARPVDGEGGRVSQTR